MQCSPYNKSNDNISCFSNDSLLKIAEAYNKNHSDKISIPNNIDRRQFWNQLKNKFHQNYKCNNETCWIDQSFINNNDLTKEIIPKKPEEWHQNKTKWLSTIEIEEVLNQFNTDTFYFIGAVPMDFDSELKNFGMCVVEELCKIDLKKLYLKGKRQIGVVFNLDPHYKPGSHWVALYIDLNKGGIYYFDSYAEFPPNEVVNLMNRLEEMGNEMILNNIIDINKLENIHTEIFENFNINDTEICINDNKNLRNCPTYLSNNVNILDINNNLDIIAINKNCLKVKNIPIDGKYLIQKGFRKFFNNIRFQFKYSECGMYSIHFITEFLRGKDFKQIISNVIDDDTMNGLRDYYFRN